MYLCAMFNKPKIAIQDFDYTLPEEQIAYTPTANRSDSKLLVWDQSIIAESNYAHIAEFIPENATLIFNNSKVIAARILFEKNNASSLNNFALNSNEENENVEKQNSIIEIFCLEPTEKYTPVLLAMQATQKVEWNCLVGGAKKWKHEVLSKKINVNNTSLIIQARKIKQDAGKFIIEFSWDHPSYTFSEILTTIGHIPLPPYIQRAVNEQDKDRYQTTYAVEEGSVAAPTAGLHFNQELFENLNEKNIHQRYLTLHVGAGTFMPVKTETIDQHTMHAEFIEVDRSLIQYLSENEASTSKPIIAVGTTSLRTIESIYWMGVKLHQHKLMQLNIISSADLNLHQWDAYELVEQSLSVKESMNVLLKWMDDHKQTKLIAKTQLMVTPGYEFKICDALITNFHQPKSTLLLIIAAITGEDWKNVYSHALANQYRFLSYGDGCLFWTHHR